MVCKGLPLHAECNKSETMFKKVYDIREIQSLPELADDLYRENQHAMLKLFIIILLVLANAIIQ